MLNAYIPTDRRLAMAARAELPDRATGAVLFADISGFTPLTEALAEELGPKLGAEQLTHHLNRVYEALIEEANGYGGSVISFSGDAITCWFDAALPEAAPPAPLRAAACALAMQEVMSRLERARTPGGRVLNLSIKVAVAAGQARRFVVGDPQIQLFDVLAGGLMDRLAAAEQAARPGEVVLSAEIPAELGPLLRLREWRHGPAAVAVLDGLAETVSHSPLPDAPPLDEDVARPWVLRRVYEQVKSGQAQFLAELRPAVALFLRFSGIDYDGDDAAGPRLNSYICQVQRVISRYDGALLQLTIGDKGSYLYAVFGAPTAHEDDAARAVGAALDLQFASVALELIGEVQLGISRGQMRAGDYGASSRRTYGVMGNHVNVAARLMSSARPGQTLVTEPVAAATVRSFAYTELLPISLKGMARPIKVLELQDRRSRPGAKARGSTMVGREAERDALFLQLDALRAGVGGSAVVTGEAGIGKSRLVEALLERAAQTGAAALVGMADAIERSTVYYAWRPIFSRALGLDSVADEQAARLAHIQARLAEDPGLLRLMPLLSSVLPLDLPDNEATALLGGAVRAEATRELLAGILQRAAREAPLLVVIEDAHWLDSASWSLVQRVSAADAPILLVLAARPFGDALPPELQAILALPSTRSLALSPLAAASVLDLVCRRLGVDMLPGPVAELIGHKAEGNPFFSEELALALRDAGLITTVDGTCRLTPGVPDLGTLSFPDSIQAVITSRIDRLQPTQQLTIKVASVIGRVFAYNTLREVHPVPDERGRLIDSLDSLARLDLTPLEAGEPDLAYAFKHVITQEVVYDLLLYAQRQRLHRAVAEWYERSFAQELAPHYAVLAYHWAQAAQIEPDAAPRAVDYALKAGDQALRNSGFVEAITILARALRIVEAMPETPGRDAQELGLRLMLAVPLTLTRGWAAPEVGAAYERAHELCRRLGETPQLFQALVGVFTYYLVAGQFRRAEEMARSNLLVAERSGDADLILEAATDMGAALFWLGRQAEGLPHLETVERLYDPEAHQPHVILYGRNPLAVTLQHHSLASWCLGRPDTALTYSDEGLELTRRWPHPFSHLWVLSARAVLHHMRGEHEAMRAAAEALVPMASEQGFPNWLAQGLVYLGWLDVRAGRAAEGIERIHQGLGLWQLTGAELFRPYLLYLLAEAHAIAGQPGEALAAIDQALAAVERSEERWWEAELHRLRGELLLAQARPEAAEASLDLAIGIARERGARSLELRAASSLARLWLAGGRAADARALLQPALDALAEGHDTRDLAEARALLAGEDR